MLLDVPIVHSSDDSDETSDEENVTMLSIIRSRKLRKPQRLENYVTALMPRFTQQQFQQHFRLSIEAYEQLLQMVGPFLQRQTYLGRSSIDIEKQLLSVIWLLATPDSYRYVLVITQILFKTDH